MRKLYWWGGYIEDKVIDSNTSNGGSNTGDVSKS